ncbi:MAG TPA: AraC family transcriptional regulator [Anaerolineales bacterium]|nr:AraC family transcriptional regulator [Anaerolineales bacterium]
MILKLHTPAFPLNRYIEQFVYYEGIEVAHSLDRFLPDGNTEIIIDLTEHPQSIYDNETLKEIQVCRDAWVSGVRTQPITIPSGKGSRMLIVAFKKGGARPFYPFPMTEITDWVVGADLIFGNNFHRLREQILHAPSVEIMFSLVEQFLLQCGGEALHADAATRCVDYAVSTIVKKPDAVGFRDFSSIVGYSQKHFIDLFKRHVGVPPKQFLKIMRFQKAILEIERGRFVNWNQIARESGFYDQAHFIHDFKGFSGFTPVEYMNRKTDMLNYVPVQ